ncbi:unnamed protein product [Prorocentrum cordatum]|uniref:AGC-kinase C-terminal domain-containing protein n=1 Tax=Prorocentrum cordatum TaxID=2364126 RepID=A0ABN9VPN8_9DINO|nr:unnamed protein product [Polarella glacialis]
MHAWFSSLNFAELEEFKVPAPYKPAMKGDNDVSNFEDIPESKDVSPAVTGATDHDPFTDGEPEPAAAVLRVRFHSVQEERGGGLGCGGGSRGCHSRPFPGAHSFCAARESGPRRPTASSGREARGGAALRFSRHPAPREQEEEEEEEPTVRKQLGRAT